MLLLAATRYSLSSRFASHRAWFADQLAVFSDRPIAGLHDQATLLPEVAIT